MDLVWFAFKCFCAFLQILSPTTLFLAAKVEEQPRKLEHVIKVAHACLNPQEPPLDTKSNVSTWSSVYCMVKCFSLWYLTFHFSQWSWFPYVHLAVPNSPALYWGLYFNYPGLLLHPTRLTLIVKWASLFGLFGHLKSVVRGDRLIDSLQLCCNDCLSNFRHTSSKLKSWWYLNP